MFDDDMSVVDSASPTDSDGDGEFGDEVMATMVDTAKEMRNGLRYGTWCSGKGQDLQQLQQN